MLPSLVLCLSAGLAAPDDLHARLEELSSASADERARAERWLAVHVTSEDFPLLAEAVLGGDAEVRRRLARALGADDASLDLAVLFALEDDPLLYGVGEEAIGEMLSRWSDGYDAPPLTGNELARVLRDVSEAEVQPEFLEIDLTAPLAVTLDRLVRLGRVPVGVCIDPSVAGRARRRIEAPEPVPFVGTWTGILFALAAAHQVDLEGVGLEPDDPRGGGAFVRFAPRETAAGPEQRRALVARWCREALLADEPRRAAAARALAATRWPGVLAWLDVRWRLHGDTSARDGVLLAAARGRRVPALGRPDVVRELLADAAAVANTVPVAEAEEGLNRILHALAAGHGLGAGGEDLSAVVLEGFGQSPLLDELRLAALEGMGSPDAEAAVFARVRAVLGAPDGEPALLRQALRTWVALVPMDEGRLEPPAIARPVALLGGGLTAWSVEECQEVARLLVVAGCEPPAAFRDPAGLGRAGLSPALVAERLAVLSWWLGRGEVETAARHLLALDPIPDEAADLLRDAVRRGDAEPARALLAAARSAAGSEAVGRRLDRVALLAGLFPPEEHAALLERLGSGPRALPVLGALAGWPGGETAQAARTRLLEELTNALAESRPFELAIPLIEAIERALCDLLAREADSEAQRLSAQASHTIRLERRASTLRDRLRATRWPPLPPAGRVRPLAERDRWLHLGGL